MANLNMKLGPLTTKMWIVVVGGLGVGLYIYRRSQAANAAPATASTDATAGISTDTPADSASYYQPSGGGGGFYDGSNYTPATPATPPPLPNAAPPTPAIGAGVATCKALLSKIRTQLDALKAKRAQMKQRSIQLATQLKAAKDVKTRAAIQAQITALASQARTVGTQIALLEARYTAAQISCAPIGVLS